MLEDSQDQLRTKSILQNVDVSAFDEISLEQLIADIQNDGDKYGIKILALMKKTRPYVQQIAKPFLNAGKLTQAELDNVQFLATSEALHYFRSDVQVCGFFGLLKMRLLTALVEISDEIAAISLPRNLRNDMRQYTRFKEVYSAEHNGKEPSAKIIAQHMNISISTVRTLEAAYTSQFVTSLDVPISSSDPDREIGITLMDALQDDGIAVEDSCLDSVFTEELHQEIDALLDGLPKLEKVAITDKYFGNGKEVDANALYRGMAKLRRPKEMSRLRPYLENSNLYLGVGLSSFRRTQTGRPEMIILQQYGDKCR